MDQTNSGQTRIKWFEPRAFEPLAQYFDRDINYQSIAIYVPADKYDIKVRSHWTGDRTLRFRLALPPLVFIAKMVAPPDIGIMPMFYKLYRLCGDVNQAGLLCVEKFCFLNVNRDGYICMGQRADPWVTQTPLERARETALHYFGSIFGGDDRSELCMRDDFLQTVAGGQPMFNPELLEHWQRLTDDGVPIPWVQTYHTFLAKELST